MTTFRQRIAGVIAAFVFIAVISCSLLYIASSYEHECTGEDCHICEMIRQCERLLDTVGNAVKSCVSRYAALFALTAVLICGSAVFGRKTLISLKVELLD